VSTRLFDDDTLPPEVVRAFGDIRRADRPHYVVTSGASTAQGARREANEDAWGQRRGEAFAVADGMGGRDGGAGAAAAAVAALLDELTVASAGIEWPEAMRRVNEAVMRQGRGAGHRRVGAAAVALRYRDGRLTVAHAGDVRAYRLRHGQVEQLTTDHTLGDELDRAGLRPGDGSDRAGLARLGRRELAALTTFFGDPGSCDGFSVRSLSVQDGDRIALCTDGVHRHVPAGAWRETALQPEPSAIADLLVGSARANRTTDDATALVVAFALDSTRPGAM
jgi:protein phosphatase